MGASSREMRRFFYLRGYACDTGSFVRCDHRHGALKGHASRARAIFYCMKMHEFLEMRKVVRLGVVYSFVIGILLLADIAFLVVAEQYLESVRLFTWIHAD